MISASAFSIKGEELKPVTLAAGVFGVKVSPQLLAQAVRVYLGNQRQSAAQTKTRGEVEGSTRKIYKQKGTGRARHGSVRAPIFVGGGIAHGPTGGQNYSGRLPAKMRRLAILGALSIKAAAKDISVIADAEKSSGKTVQSSWLASGKSILVVSTSELDKFNRACRNLHRVDVVKANQLTTYQVMAHQKLVLAQPALEVLIKTYAA
ncbi:MAG: 50S ribosomal protein L4 [bacterium]|nr:50S ribosomal protein L4 [bacterium]